MKFMQNKGLILIACVVTVIVIVGSVFIYFTHKDNNVGTSGTSNEPNTFSSETYTNEFTGLSIDEKSKDSRPIAVVLGNTEAAQPILGFDDADIIYECPIENGVTRLLAVYKNASKVSKIGSVRGTYSTFLSIANGLDAVSVHLDGSDGAKSLLQSHSEIAYIDLVSHGDLYERDSNRMEKLGIENSTVISGQKIFQSLAGLNISDKVNSIASFKQQFSESKSQVQNGQNATEVVANIFESKKTTFNYNKTRENYTITQFESQNNSKSSNTKVNIIFIKADFSAESGINIVGSGSGKYMSHGRILDINWSKTSNNSPIKYTTTANEELIMCPGKTYVCILPSSHDITVS